MCKSVQKCSAFPSSYISTNLTLHYTLCNKNVSIYQTRLKSKTTPWPQAVPMGKTTKMYQQIKVDFNIVTNSGNKSILFLTVMTKFALKLKIRNIP